MANKRGQNEGSIYKRKNGTWRAQVTLDGKRLSFCAKTRGECQEWLKATIGQIDKGLTIAGARSTLGDFFIEWLTSVKSSVRPRTWAQYQQIYRDYIAPDLGGKTLKDIHPMNIQSLYNAKLESGHGERTVQLVHAVLHNVLEQAVKMGIISRNPADAVSPPKPRHKEMKFLDEAQVTQFLISAKGDRNEALFHMAIATGMRQSELLGLLWTDLDWRKKTVYVQRQLRRNFRDGNYFSAPKTKAGKRTIVLGARTLDVLREHWGLQNQERIEAGDRWEENGLIFPSSVGTPMDHSNLLKGFKKALKLAGLPEIRFHDLRHTASSLMLNHGIPVIVVSRRLGHSKVSITLDTYGHLMPEMQNEAAELMDDLITPVEVGLHRVAPKNEV